MAINQQVHPGTLLVRSHYNSPPTALGRRLSGRTQHLETYDDFEWPALPSHKNASSTPVPKVKQPWTKATTKATSKLPQDTGILLENRFAPLSQNPDSLKEGLPSSSRERYEANAYAKRLQKELTTGPHTLIVGDGAVNEIKRFCSKNTKVLCFTNAMVSDISKKILNIAAEHPTAKALIIHTGALDVAKQQSEVLKQDFTDLINKVRCLNTEVFFSGPIPGVRQGDENFSRLMMLNRWLKDTCAAQSMNFIDNFNIFWGRSEIQQSEREPPASSSSPPKMEAPTAQRGESHQTPAGETQPSPPGADWDKNSALAFSVQTSPLHYQRTLHRSPQICSISSHAYYKGKSYSVIAVNK